MRIAMTSDTHLGDSRSLMAFRDSKTGVIQEGKLYQTFRNAIQEKTQGKPVDYLVLIGDILDFSIVDYSEAYHIGRFFFQKIKDDRLAKEIIYIPGNHDFDIWNTVEYQVNITNRVIRGKAPRRFRMSVPAIIDDRKSRFMLHRVRIHQEKDMPQYAGLFLDSLTNPPTPFNFCYPNLYLITADETVIITHGQYLDGYWSFLGTWSLPIFDGDLPVEDPVQLNLGELVAVNFPLSQMECSAVGQAGPLTEVVKKIQHEINEYDHRRIHLYFDRIQQGLKEQWRGIGGSFNRLLFHLVKKKILKGLNEIQSARYAEEFVKNPKVRERFINFLSSTLLELEALHNENGIEIPTPTRMIFGHTHQPKPWGAQDAPSVDLPGLPPGKRFMIYNSGSWLPKVNKNGKSIFYGAEIFFYKSQEGFSSIHVGRDDHT